jgi:hypothetical protein
MAFTREVTGAPAAQPMATNPPAMISSSARSRSTMEVSWEE